MWTSSDHFTHDEALALVAAPGKKSNEYCDEDHK